MEFDIVKVKKDIAKAKSLLFKNPMITEKFLRIGTGCQSLGVFAYKNAAVKEVVLSGERIENELKKQEQYKKLSEIAINRGICMAPVLDDLVTKTQGKFYQTASIFSFMPKLNGETFKSGGHALKSVLKMGKCGLHKFFNDYVELHDIGFAADNNKLADNYMATKKNIYMFDMEIEKTVFSHAELYLDAARQVFSIWGGDEQMRRELYANTANVLAKIPNAHEAFAYAKEFEKS
jgi:hypothetical protein